MGEVIRNIGNIRIADEIFRIEENESIPKSLEHTIHIQNERFRMEMSEGEFLHICYSLIFAGEQLEAVKKITQIEENYKRHVKVKYVNDNTIFDVFSQLSEAKIDYIMLCDMYNEDIENIYKNGISILVKNEHTAMLGKILEANGFKREIHPYGKLAGYELAYNLHDFQKWVNKSIGISLEICCEMCCMSLSPKTWVPLSKEINHDVWEYRIWNSNLNCWRPEVAMEELYLIVKCVFNMHGFLNEYIEEIEKRKEVIHTERFQKYLKSIFWGFTEELIIAIENKKYESIFQKYITYKNY